MREIKFRVWDSSEKEMVDWAGALYDPDNWLFDVFAQYQDYFLHGKEKPEDILMQYTGLKDKNGKEIYEGDIVLGKSDTYYADHNLYKYEVKWGELHDVDYPIHCFGYPFPDGMLEIIGNIYENPELLEAK